MFLLLLNFATSALWIRTPPGLREKIDREKLESNYCGYSIDTCELYFWYYGYMPDCCYAYANSMNLAENSDDTPRRVQRAAKGFPEDFFDWVPSKPVDRAIAFKRPGGFDHDENSQSLTDMASAAAQKSRPKIQDSGYSGHETIKAKG